MPFSNLIFFPSQKNILKNFISMIQCTAAVLRLKALNMDQFFVLYWKPAYFRINFLGLAKKMTYEFMYAVKIRLFSNIFCCLCVGSPSCVLSRIEHFILTRNHAKAFVTKKNGYDFLISVGIVFETRVCRRVYFY